MRVTPWPEKGGGGNKSKTKARKKVLLSFASSHHCTKTHERNCFKGKRTNFGSLFLRAPSCHRVALLLRSCAEKEYHSTRTWWSGFTHLLMFQKPRKQKKARDKVCPSGAPIVIQLICFPLPLNNVTILQIQKFVNLWVSPVLTF